MKIKTIIFGATGMVGEGVLHKSLLDPNVESVLVLGRKSSSVNHGKMKELIHQDFFDYSSIENQLKGYNACFFCLGVSSVGMKEADYRRITYELTMSAARILSAVNHEMTFCYVSGTGTDSSEKGRMMWARVKGKTENDLMKLSFKSVYAFRPGFIKPIKGLRNAYGISKALGSIYPLLKSLFPQQVCTLDDLGQAMIQVVLKGYPKKVLENKDIERLARQAEVWIEDRK